jgi:hypothetical protein
MDKYYKINTPAVISEPMEDDLVVINLDNGCYYCLNTTAALLWNQLEKGCSINRAARQTAQIYGNEEAMVLADCASFIERLIKEQLIRVAEGEPTINGISFNQGQDKPYQMPNFVKYSDMQEMLLLDPIHEVSEAGWPHHENK